VLRSSYREGGKVKHKNVGRILNRTLDELRLIQAAFRGAVSPQGAVESFELLGSKEYGASRALLKLAQELGLDRALYSRREAWVQDCLAMIVGRVIYSGSKLALSNEWKSTELWELCGVSGPVDVERHCYLPMDRLLERQAAVQRYLGKKELKDGRLVLYDITSTYFEGAYAESDLVLFGYNRDNKSGHEQVVAGLLCNSRGCPVGVEVFAGNTQDAATVVAKIQELRREYGLKDIVFVGDRGMLTQANLAKLQGAQDLHTITVLAHRQIVELLNRKVIQTSLFDERQTVEIIDPEQPQLRYCLCKNLATQAHETATRKRLLELTKAELNKVAARRNKTAPERLGAQVARVLNRYKTSKFVEWQNSAGHLVWQFKEAEILQAQLLDGCYVVRSDVKAAELPKDAVVSAYKSLSLVEQAFRNLKMVALEMRPVYHKKDDRIRSHIFLCVLAYYLQWYLQQRLLPLFEQNGVGKQRQWTLANVIERLKAIRIQTIRSAGIEFKRVTSPDAEQQRILDLLGVAL
jgi:transposase